MRQFVALAERNIARTMPLEFQSVALCTPIYGVIERERLNLVPGNVPVGVASTDIITCIIQRERGQAQQQGQEAKRA